MEGALATATTENLPDSVFRDSLQWIPAKADTAVVTGMFRYTHHKVVVYIILNMIF
jgi:hypothetical protein